MFRLTLLALVALPSLALAQPKTHQVKLNGHTFTLPEGFTIEVAADAKLAPRPIACDFDPKGRLYVTDSSGSNEKVQVQLEKKPHRVLRLEDTNGDGAFDKQTVFVKNIMFPEGCMWFNGSLYVAAPPHILKFTDTDDDGVADKEEIWFDGKTLTGCANDLHGPYRGPDGYIYWTKGAFAKQEYKGGDVPDFTTRAAHILRDFPSHDHIEPVMTGGMDNPVDVVFTPGGDVIFSTTFFQHPGGGKRDGLVHAVYGGVYGKDHDVVYDHMWTSPHLMPVLTHMGPAAPCGLHRYESDQFGKDYANNLFCCQFNLRKVSRHVLVPKGSTYETKDSDFVVSDSIDFHPTDVIEDADGSLLIVDTGGWYKLCCPTSQLVKPDVTGAIYRVRKTGSHKIGDPRGLTIDWAKQDENQLGKLLHDPRPAVRHRVTAEVETRERITAFDVAVAAIKSGNTEYGTIAALWLLLRDGMGEPILLAGALTLDEREEVRLAAVSVISRFGIFDDRCQYYVEKRLKDKSPRVRRVAAEAFGRIHRWDIAPDHEVAAIFEALADEQNDRALDHALTYALIEINGVGATRKGLKHESPRVRRAALAALENIPALAARYDSTKPGLDVKDVLPELDAKDAALRETAWWVFSRHPQWGEHLAGYFKEKLKAADKLSAVEREELAARLVKFTGGEAVQKVLGESLVGAGVAKFALGVMARSGRKALPPAWRDALLGLAPDLDDRELLRGALAVFRALPAEAKDYDAFVSGLPRAKLWPGGAVPADFRLALLAARPANQSLDRPSVSLLLGLIDREQPGADRAAAADVLLRANLSPEQLATLAGKLKTASPLDLAKLLGAFAKSTDEKAGLALVAALREKEVQPAIRAEMVKPIFDKYPQTVRAEAEKLYAELAEARKGETAKLEKMLANLKPGDVRRGQVVFNSTKAQCIACHKMGYVGGLAGPDLTRIGGIRTERDLLESILFPSASFVRSYEPVRVVTTDQRVLNGVLKKDAPDEIIVVTAADKEERIARADIDTLAPSTVSLMPAGLEQQLSAQDIADLIAFLKASK